MTESMQVVEGRKVTKIPPRERILQAADDLFVRYGIRGVGVEAIAEAADTNKMTLYRHFPSKDDLVAAWLQRLFDEWNEVWVEVEEMPDGDRAAQIEAFLRAIGNALELCAVRGCPFMNSLAEIPEKDHPARRVLDDYKSMNRARMMRFFRRIGLSKPSQAADELYILFDGAKAGIQDIGVKRSRARFTKMAKAMIEAHSPA